MLTEDMVQGYATLNDVVEHGIVPALESGEQVYVKDIYGLAEKVSQFDSNTQNFHMVGDDEVFWDAVFEHIVHEPGEDVESYGM